MHFLTILLFVGAGYAAYKGYGWWYAKNAPATGTPMGRSYGSVSGTTQLQTVQDAAHDDTGSGDVTNVYDAVLGVAATVGSVVQTGIGSATGEVADNTADVVDKVATARAEDG